MEPVGLAVGLLPVAGGALKASRSIHKKLKVFRHHTREIRHFQKLIERQRDCFTNEIQLLLRQAIQDDFLTEDMMKYPQNPEWYSDNFEERMKKALGRSYDACKSAVQDVSSIMEKIQLEFSCLDEVLGDGETVS